MLTRYDCSLRSMTSLIGSIHTRVCTKCTQMPQASSWVHRLAFCNVGLRLCDLTETLSESIAGNALPDFLNPN